MNYRPAFWLFITTLSFVACGPGYSYEKTYSIDSASWNHADSLEFSFKITDTLQLYNLWLEVEHSVDYKYQNLYTRINTHFPSGQQLHEQLSLEMADKVGRWYGDCNSSYCSLLIPIQQGAYFSQEGTYQLIVEQYMRQNPVSGIRSVGFFLEPTRQNR